MLLKHITVMHVTQGVWNTKISNLEAMKSAFLKEKIAKKIITAIKPNDCSLRVSQCFSTRHWPKSSDSPISITYVGSVSKSRFLKSGHIIYILYLFSNATSLGNVSNMFAAVQTDLFKILSNLFT